MFHRTELRPRILRRNAQTTHFDSTFSEDKPRVRINVRGMTYETYQQTLDQFPDTLLGCPEKRRHYYDPIRNEYFIDRSSMLFDVILFYYQSSGILARPDFIPCEDFVEELRFYELENHHHGSYHVSSYNDTMTQTTDSVNLLRTRREKLWNVLERPIVSRGSIILGRIFITVILLSVVAFCLETVPQLSHWGPITTLPRNSSSDVLSDDLIAEANPTAPGYFWFITEAVFVTWFTGEYLLRLYAAPKRCKFVFSTLGVVDLLAILPFYITLAFEVRVENASSFAVLRLFRLLRVLRLFKLSRYSNHLKVLCIALKDSTRPLKTLMLSVVICIVLFSSAVYYAEGEGEDGNFNSIPDAFWWSIVTMTTVGYGDMVPKSVFGRITGALCILTGIIVLFCLPTPIFISNFSKIYEMITKSKNKQIKEEDMKNSMLESSASSY